MMYSTTSKGTAAVLALTTAQAAPALLVRTSILTSTGIRLRVQTTSLSGTTQCLAYQRLALGSNVATMVSSTGFGLF